MKNSFFHVGGSFVGLEASAVDVRTAECFVALCRRPLTGLAIIFR